MQLWHRLSILACLAACHSNDRSSPRVIVSNENAGTVSIIDPGTSAVLGTISVGKRPRGLRVSPDGKTLYVALSGSPKGGPGIDESQLPPPDRSADGIGVVDLDSLKLIKVIKSGQDPETFDLVGDGTLVVSNEETSEASIVDLQTGTVRTHVPVGGEPEGVTTAPDGTVWVTSEADHAVSVIDPVTGKLLATVQTGARPRAIAFHGTLGVVGGETDGSLTFIDTKTRTAIGRIDLPKIGTAAARPAGIAIAPNGHTAYVATGRAGAVVVVDLETRKVVRTIEGVGARPWGITLGKDGMLYTANGPSDDVSMIDPKTGEIVSRIHSGGSPWGVVSI